MCVCESACTTACECVCVVVVFVCVSVHLPEKKLILWILRHKDIVPAVRDNL